MEFSGTSFHSRILGISQHGPNLLTDWLWGSWMLILSSTGNELKESTEILVVLPSQDVNVSIDRKLFSVSFSHRVGLWSKKTQTACGISQQRSWCQNQWMYKWWSNSSTPKSLAKISPSPTKPSPQEELLSSCGPGWNRTVMGIPCYTHSGDWLPFCFMAEKSFVFSFTNLHHVAQIVGTWGTLFYNNGKIQESMGELDESWIDRMAISWHSGLLGIPQTSPGKQTAGVSPLLIFLRRLLLREWRELPSWCLSNILLWVKVRLPILSTFKILYIYIYCLIVII